MADSADAFRYGPNDLRYNAHHAVVDLTPARSSVLEVGCASGYLMQALRDDKGCCCTGLEPDVSSADSAASKGFRVERGQLDGTSVARLRTAGPFDVVVLADVLEHMPDPQAGLAWACELLAPGGRLVVSLPNVGYVQARWRLARGVFDYEETGIFDATHLRFFTVSSARRAFAQSRLNVVEERYVGWLTHRFGQRALKVNALRPQLLAFQMVFALTPDGR